MRKDWLVICLAPAFFLTDLNLHSQEILTDIPVLLDGEVTEADNLVEIPIGKTPWGVGYRGRTIHIGDSELQLVMVLGPPLNVSADKSQEKKMRWNGIVATIDDGHVIGLEITSQDFSVLEVMRVGLSLKDLRRVFSERLVAIAKKFTYSNHQTINFTFEQRTDKLVTSYLNWASDGSGFISIEFSFQDLRLISRISIDKFDIGK